MQRPEKLLLVFFGMVATGKSYLASAWAAEHDLPYYNSDRLRKELAGTLADTGQGEALGQGIYSAEFSRRTYDGLIEKASVCFHEDETTCVVLDASYQALAERDLLRQRFDVQCRVVFVHCFCKEAIVRERLTVRASDSAAVSDGTWEIYQAQKQRFQEPLEREQIVAIDTDGPIAELIKRVTTVVEYERV